MEPMTKVESTIAPGTDGLGRAIAGLLGEIVTVVEAANTGQLIELDMLAMRITVLCDSLRDSGSEAKGHWRQELRDLNTALAVLDAVLRKQNVQLLLNIEQLRRHLSPAD